MCECSCDASYPDFYDESTPVARKEHRCDECGSVIDKGERYRRITGKWDGEISTIKQCSFCQKIYDQEAGEHCINLGSLWSCVDADAVAQY